MRFELSAVNSPASPTSIEGYGSVHFSTKNEVEKSILCSAQESRWADWTLTKSELRTFKIVPKRWVVERSSAWLQKSRRLWKNCELLLNTSLRFIHMAYLALLLRRSQTRSKIAVTGIYVVLSDRRPKGAAAGRHIWTDTIFGMKAHIGVDAASGLVHTVVGTAANVNDLNVAG